MVTVGRGWHKYAARTAAELRAAHDRPRERHNVLATGAAELALGGTQMMYFRYDPPAITLFDVATGGANPRVVWLPEGSDTSMGHRD